MDNKISINFKIGGDKPPYTITLKQNSDIIYTQNNVLSGQTVTINTLEYNTLYNLYVIDEISHQIVYPFTTLNSTTTTLPPRAFSSGFSDGFS